MNRTNSLRLCVLMLVWLHGARSHTEILAPDWEVFDVGEGIKPSFDFDVNGRIHVMGITEEFQGVVWHAAADAPSGPWEPEVVYASHFYGPGDIRVGAHGTVHIAVHDHNEEDAAHVSISPEGTIKRQFVRTANTHDGWDNSLAFDSHGNLHQAHVDPSGFGAVNSLQFASFDGSNWTSEKIIGSNSFMYGFNTSLAFDQSDQPHILYTGATDWTAPGDLRHAFRTNRGWRVESVVTDGIRGRFPSLVFDNKNRGHAAWFDVDPDDTTLGTVSYGLLENGTWTTSPVDELDDVVLEFGGARKMVSIDVDSSDVPSIGYGDQQTVRYAKKTTAGWDTQVVLQTEDAPFNSLVVMRLSPIDDKPTMVFWQPVDFLGIVRILTFNPSTPDGDFNVDGILDAIDIDELTNQVAANSEDLRFDLNSDDRIDTKDRLFWIEDIKNTFLGDSNLDGEFSSTDFVQVFQAGEYEDGIERNSTWAEGDWDGNLEFESADFVLAFKTNAYEQGPRRELISVPEPNPVACLSLFLICGIMRRFV